MFKERILNKKFNTLNEFKSKLVSRSDESKEDIIEEIKENIEDLEIALEDFGYINTSNENREYGEFNEDILVEVGDNEINDELDVNDFRQTKTFTLEEISKYNGKDGKPAYVVINGTVYDVTDNPYWKEGQHFGVKAGTVLTDSFYSSHLKNPEILKKLRVVGVIKEWY